MMLTGGCFPTPFSTFYQDGTHAFKLVFQQFICNARSVIHNKFSLIIGTFSQLANNPLVNL